jgi:uncharacterized heparinase superfamily protein
MTPNNQPGEQVLSHHVLVLRKGEIPEVKRPMLNSRADVVRLLREIRAGEPAGTELVLLEIAYGGSIWATCEKEVLSMHEALRESQEELS